MKLSTVNRTVDAVGLFFCPRYANDKIMREDDEMRESDEKQTTRNKRTNERKESNINEGKYEMLTKVFYENT